MTEIRLQRQKRANHNRQDERIQTTRRTTNLKRGSHQPRSHDHKPGLKKFRRLQRCKAKRIPTHRPFAEIRAEKRQAHQGNKSDQKSKNCQAPDQLRGHHRRQQHSNHRQPTKDRLTAYIMKRLKPVFAGQWGRRRQPQQQTNAKQHQHTAHCPFVNCPPPPWENRVTRINRDRAIDHFCHGITANTASNRPIFRV